MVIQYSVTMTSEVGSEVGIREIKARLSDLVNRVIYRGEVIWVTKNGKRVAALVPVEVAEKYFSERDAEHVAVEDQAAEG